MIYGPKKNVNAVLSLSVLNIARALAHIHLVLRAVNDLASDYLF